MVQRNLDGLGQRENRRIAAGSCASNNIPVIKAVAAIVQPSGFVDLACFIVESQSFSSTGPDIFWLGRLVRPTCLIQLQRLFRRA